MPRSREVRFETRFSLESPAYVPDHRVFGVLVVAGASHVSMVLQAAAEAFGDNPRELQEIFFLQPFVLEKDGARMAQLVFTPDGDELSFELMSLPGGTDEYDPESWVVHATGRLRQQAGGTKDEKPSLTSVDLAALQRRCTEQVEGKDFYGSFWVQGSDAGPSFRWIETLWKGDGEALAVTYCPPLEDDVRSYQLHPGLIEACFQVMRGAKEFESQELLAKGGDIYVPFGIQSVRFFRRPTTDRLWCHARMRDGGTGQSFTADLSLFDQTGRPVAEIDAFEVRRLPRVNLLKSLRGDTSDWVYELLWEERSLVSGKVPPRTAAGTWLIFADESGLGSRLADDIERSGARALLVTSSNAYSGGDRGMWAIDASNPEHYKCLLEDTRKATNDPLRGIVHLWSIEGDGPKLAAAEVERAQIVGSESALLLVQALMRSDTSTSLRLLLVTRGVQGVGLSKPPAIAHAPMWGLARVVRLESPELDCVCLDLDPERRGGERREVLDELLAGDGEDTVVLRRGRRLVARLTSASKRPRKEHALSVSSDAAYLVTGGLRGLGLEAAKWLVARGARYLALMGRRPPFEEVRETLAELQSKGARVLVAQADVSKADDVARVLASVREQLPPLRGIVHAAGVLDDGVVLQQTPERFRTVMAPKVAGALHLHAQTEKLPLDFFVCFSSAASLLGAGGQANYAAANAFLDAFAHFRSSQAQPATTVNWGPWADVGMAAQLNERDRSRQHDVGWDAIALDSGFELLGALIASNVVQAGVFPLNWSRFARSFPEGVVPRFLEKVARQKDTDSTRAKPKERRNVAHELQEAAVEARRDLLNGYVKSEVASLLGLPNGASLDPKEGFSGMGMDSLMSVELRSRLQSGLGIKLSSTFAFDYSNVEDVTRYLAVILFVDESGAAGERALPAATPDRNRQPIEARGGIGDEDADASIEEELFKLEARLDRDA